MCSLLLPATNAMAAAGAADVAQDDPGLFLFMMVIALAFLGAVLIAVAGIVMLLLLIAALVAFGLFSMSVITAWYYRSAARGLNVFVCAVFAILGAAGSLLAAWLIQYNKQAHFSSDTVVITVCLCAGIAGGLLTGRLFLYVVKNLFRYISRKMA